MPQEAPPMAVVEAPAVQPVQVSGFGLGIATVSDLRRTRFTDERVDLSKEAALIVEARRGRAVVRLRGSTADPASGSAQVQVSEASVGLAATPGLTMRLGKAQLSWDTGLAFQPVGFFQRRLDFSDLGDFEGRGEGLPLVAVSYGTGVVAATVVASDRLSNRDVASERSPRRQAAARLTVDLTGISASVIVRKPEGFATGVGGTFSATLSERLTAYGSFYHDRRSTRAAVGGSVAAPWQGTITVEYAHDSSGRSDRQVAGSIASGAIVQVEGVSFRENYLYGQASVEAGRFGVALGARAGLDDGGILATLSGTLRIARSAEIRVVGLLLGGPQRSEYRQSVLRSLFSLAFRRAF